MAKFRSLVAALALGAGMSVAAQAAEVTLIVHHFIGPKAPTHTVLVQPWADAIEAQSDGRIDVEIHPSMALGGKPSELYGQVRDGTVDIVWTLIGYTPGVFPRTEVFELPTVHGGSARATSMAIQDMFDMVAPDFEDIKVLLLHVHQGNALHTVSKEITSIEDVAGLKLRTPSRTGSWMIEAWGAEPVGMPVPELPQALSKKVVDGALIPWEIIAPLKLQDLTDYQIEGHNKTRFGTTTFQVSMNLAKWNSLPDDLKKIFSDNSGPEWLAEVGEIWRNSDDGGIEMAQKAGNTYIELTEEETAAFREKLEPVVQRWVKEVEGQGIDGAKLVEAARAAIAKHSKTN
jgi:TRAP-type C4-dicarboxylate transport system substrate-binding protein